MFAKTLAVAALGLLSSGLGFDSNETPCKDLCDEVLHCDKTTKLDQRLICYHRRIRCRLVCREYQTSDRMEENDFSSREDDDAQERSSHEKPSSLWKFEDFSDVSGSTKHYFKKIPMFGWLPPYSAKDWSFPFSEQSAYSRRSHRGEDIYVRAKRYSTLERFLKSVKAAFRIPGLILKGKLGGNFSGGISFEIDKGLKSRVNAEVSGYIGDGNSPDIGGKVGGHIGARLNQLAEGLQASGDIDVIGSGVGQVGDVRVRGHIGTNMNGSLARLHNKSIVAEGNADIEGCAGGRFRKMKLKGHGQSGMNIRGKIESRYNGIDVMGETGSDTSGRLQGSDGDVHYDEEDTKCGPNFIKKNKMSVGSDIYVRKPELNSEGNGSKIEVGINKDTGAIHNCTNHVCTNDSAINLRRGTGDGLESNVASQGDYQNRDADLKPNNATIVKVGNATDVLVNRLGTLLGRSNNPATNQSVQLRGLWSTLDDKDAILTRGIANITDRGLTSKKKKRETRFMGRLVLHSHHRKHHKEGGLHNIAHSLSQPITTNYVANPNDLQDSSLESDYVKKTYSYQQLTTNFTPIIDNNLHLPSINYWPNSTTTLLKSTTNTKRKLTTTLAPTTTTTLQPKTTTITSFSDYMYPSFNLK